MEEGVAEVVEQEEGHMLLKPVLQKQARLQPLHLQVQRRSESVQQYHFDPPKDATTSIHEFVEYQRLLPQHYHRFGCLSCWWKLMHWYVILA